MRRLYLHCGLHKTGTTSLQKALFDNRGWLAGQGVLYPQTGLSPPDQHAWGHHPAVMALRRLLPARQMWRALRAEADASGAQTVVVSSELLSDLPYPSLPALRPFRVIANSFDGWDIRVVCYLRPQADMLASLYVHQVKSRGEMGDIYDFMLRAAPKLDYAGWLAKVEKIFGRRAILLRRYLPEHLVGGDTVRDFAQLIGLDLESRGNQAEIDSVFAKGLRSIFRPSAGFEMPKAPLNSGLTARGLQEMLEANHRFSEAPDDLFRVRQHILKAHAAAAFEGADPLGPDLRRAIAALYALRNRHLARIYLGESGELFDQV